MFIVAVSSNAVHGFSKESRAAITLVAGLDDAEGKLIRKAGVMAIVLTGGEAHPGDAIQVTLPPEPHRPLEPV